MPNARAPVAGDAPSDLSGRTELESLHCENQDLRTDNEFLGKAAAIFV